MAARRLPGKSWVVLNVKRITHHQNRERERAEMRSQVVVWQLAKAIVRCSYRTKFKPLPGGRGKVVWWRRGWSFDVFVLDNISRRIGVSLNTQSKLIDLLLCCQLPSYMLRTSLKSDGGRKHLRDEVFLKILRMWLSGVNGNWWWKHSSGAGVMEVRG